LPAVTSKPTASSPPARLAAAGNERSLTTGLWFASLTVAVAAAAVIGVLLLRRRRLYPPGGAGPRTPPAGGPADGAAS
jgi:hypothetical protein